jgi:hypothetical protein
VLASLWKPSICEQHGAVSHRHSKALLILDGGLTCWQAREKADGVGQKTHKGSISVARTNRLRRDLHTYTLKECGPESRSRDHGDSSLSRGYLHLRSQSLDPLLHGGAAFQIRVLRGCRTARAAWAHMVGQRFGRIVYMPSAGIYGALGNTDYAAAKAAYIGMMRCLALEGAKHGILVNAVAPSARTRMTERFHPSAYADWFFETMTPEKVAVGVAYLLSEECEIHGEIFAMGGGRIARVMLAEGEGVIGAGSSIEEVRDMMGRVMADTKFFYPKDLTERSRTVAELFGFGGSLEASNDYAVRPIGKG